MSVGAPSLRMTRSLATSWRAALLALCVLGVSGVARAHPDLDTAKQLAADLELEESLAAFERALQSGSLTRDELVELLSERAFVLHALHKKAELVQNFIWLSALEPDHRLDLRAPPDLTAIWTSVRDQGRGQLKLTLEAVADGQGGLHARATPTGTVPEGLRTEIVRRKVGGKYERKTGPELREPVQAGAVLELYAQATGLGQVVVAEAFSAERPLRVTASAASNLVLSPTVDFEKDESPSWLRRNRGWVIGGAAVVVGVVVLSSVLATRDKDDNSKNTNLTPMVSF